MRKSNLNENEKDMKGNESITRSIFSKIITRSIFSEIDEKGDPFEKIEQFLKYIAGK